MKPRRSLNWPPSTAPRYIAKCGNTYSSEWWWSKIWKCSKVAPEVFDAASSWVELSDWVPSVLAGVTDPRKVNAASAPPATRRSTADDWGGLPDKEFLSLLDPKLASLRDRLYDKAYDATDACRFALRRMGEKAGHPRRHPDRDRRVRRALRRHRLRRGRRHAGQGHRHLAPAIAASIKPNKTVADIPGICGIVPGAILPGYYGIEAGQTAVGDIFKWWVEVRLQRRRRPARRS